MHEAGLSRRQDLEPVAEHEHHVGAQLFECVGHAHHPEADRLRDAAGGVAGHEHFDAAGDGEAVAFDLRDGQAELRREVHAGHDELEFDVGVRAQVVQDPVKQTVVGAAPRDHTNALRHDSQAPSLALLGRLITLASRRAAVAEWHRAGRSRTSAADASASTPAVSRNLRR